jgi:tetrahydromethanopterin S-methyltransferase subunit C
MGKKKETFIRMLYRVLGQGFATIFLFLFGLIFLALIFGILYFVFEILVLLKPVLYAIIGFIIGCLLARWFK